jgi:hypothetical protein
VYFLRATEIFNINDDKFFDNKINESDKKYLKFLCEDDTSSFKLIYSDKIEKTKVNVFYSGTNYLPNVTTFKSIGVIKSHMTTNHSFENMVYTLGRLNKRSDKRVRKVDLQKIVYDEDNLFPTTLQEVEMKLGFVKLRKFFNLSQCEYDKEKEIFYVFIKPCKSIQLTLDLSEKLYDKDKKLDFFSKRIDEETKEEFFYGYNYMMIKIKKINSNLTEVFNIVRNSIFKV